MSGPARAQASIADSTALYLCSSESCPPRDRVIWSILADVRGNFPGYVGTADALNAARVELTPNYLFVDSSPNTFVIPTSAIERVALVSPIDRPNGAILLVDYCDSTRTVRRLWLRVNRRRIPSPSVSRLRRFTTQFEAAGVARVDTGDVVTGLRTTTRSSDPQSFEQEKAEWSGEATISLASGDYPATISVDENWVHASIFDTVVRLRRSEIVGFTVVEDRLVRAGQTAFLTFWEDETRIDLRLRFSSDGPGVHESAAREFTELLERYGVPNLAEDRRPLVRAGSEVARAAGGPSDDDETWKGRTSGLFEISRTDRRAGKSENRSSSVDQQPVREVRVGQETRSGNTRADQGSHDVTLRDHVAARLQAARSLRDAELISDDDWQQQRARILLEADVMDRLFQLRALRDSGLITVGEFDEKRSELIEVL